MRIAVFLGFTSFCYWFSPLLNAQDQEVQDSPADEPPVYATYNSLVFGRPQPITDTTSPIADTQVNTGRLENQADQPPALAIIASLDNYQASIESFEQRGGAWDQSLAQELVATGSLFQQQGEHLEAIKAYSRALQVNRINFGLDNLQQVPLVEQLISNHQVLGQWEKADQYQNYLYYTERKAYGGNHPNMIATYERLGNWSLNMFYLGYGEAVGRRLIVAFNAFRSASLIVEENYGEDDDRYVKYLREMASTAFLVSVNRELMLKSAGSDTQGQTTYYDTSSGRFEDVYGLNPAGFSEGLEALEQIVDSYTEQGDKPIELAKALVSLADWHFLYKRQRSASGYYQEAYELLLSTERGEELIREDFDNVIPLPNLSENIEAVRTRAAQLGSQNRTGFLDVTFDVSRSGNIRNLQFLTELSEENSMIQSRLRQRLRSSVFRPVLIDGELTSKQGNKFRYQYWY